VVTEKKDPFLLLFLLAMHGAEVNGLPRMGWLVLIQKCALYGMIDFFSAWR